ncbi:hypothetical protein DB32_004310 [Sandaracinus amylolyticus]|uniref:Uncharacterized protein n=1 Tax=Sandaracinus amylolyticus TaxID=927083 RepID=A0A0F6W4F9_9BACT|nr:hypothetical protein DB32_004310 [Sandaracinus amylolyticus]
MECSWGPSFTPISGSVQGWRDAFFPDGSELSHGTREA